MADKQSTAIGGKRINADGVGTYYLEQGAGAPVVLLHGSGPGVSAAANWGHIVPELASNFYVVAPDLMGFGRTDKLLGNEYTLTRWRQHLTAFLDQIGLERVSMAGNSFGGALALSFAVNCPDRIDRLVLMGSVGTEFELTPGLDEVWGYRPSTENMRRLIEIFVSDGDRVTDDLVRQRLEASTEAGIQEAYSSMFPAPRQRWVDAMVTPDEELRRLPHEVLLLHGREDAVIPLESSRHLAAVIPNSQLHEFSRCGHWVQVEQRQRFVQLVTWFLSEETAPDPVPVGV